MIVTGPWLKARGTQKVLGLLSQGGYQALAVGGCVRNQLLGMAVADVDIATDAPPDTVTRLAGKAGLKSVPTGYAHGTITLVADGAGYQVTTFRRDVTTDGRRAKVQFSGNIAEDAGRRDFTMNALYVEADGTLIDPLDGLSDVQGRRLRFINSPTDRIREDYLRILRFFRFFAWYANPETGPDGQALSACREERGGLSMLADERIGVELRKLLAAPNPVPALAAMVDVGVLDMVLPDASAECIGNLVKLETAAQVAPDWQTRLVGLGGRRKTQRMRLSKAEAKHQKAIRKALEARTPAEAAYHHGADAAHAAALLTTARGGKVGLPNSLQGEIAKGAGAEFPVTAADLLAEIPAGPALGKRLDLLRDRWIASDFTMGRDELLNG